MHKVALLGAGRIGRIHADNVAAHPQLALAYVVDPQVENAQAIATRTGAVAATLDAALADADIDGVIVASPTDAHLDHCLRAHAAGKAIFCEKPIDLDLRRATTEGAALAGARLFLGFNRRFDPNFATLKQRLDAGAAGALETLQITSNDPGPPPISYVAVSGGLFKDMAIHDLDMARWLLPEAPSEVFAWGASLVDPAIGQAGDVDTARILLRTPGGRMCVIANSRRSGFGYDQRIEAYCAGGLVRADNVRESTVETWTETGVQSDAFQNFFLQRYAAAYRAEIDHFAEILDGRAAPAITYEDGLAALRLAEAAQQSLRTGAPVTL
jgi:myo-inositol 2-dehydrogenase/D-chiro-inositol 1-dehydrogenase